ncbi:hypothetical protein R1flu_021783 [Riccia fluitans]|uniref:Uncharacterized protein n=1 Tax=Riccia fluitans TaxID=41844 RepID=A0ABD1ZQC7_9MARC
MSFWWFWEELLVRITRRSSPRPVEPTNIQERYPRFLGTGVRSHRWLQLHLSILQQFFFPFYVFLWCSSIFWSRLSHLKVIFGVYRTSLC